MELVGHRVIPPVLHVAADEVERRHSLDLASVCLPQRREPGFARPSCCVGFVELRLTEVRTSEETTLLGRDRVARIWVDQPTEIPPAPGDRECMFPKIAELALLFTHDEERGARAKSAPPSPPHTAQLRERGGKTADDGLAFLELHLNDAVGVLRIAAIAQVLDDEGPGAGNGEQRLTRPLVNNVRWAHYER